MARVQDPVCGMMVDSSTAEWKADHQGETYYFCSAECEQRFTAEPSRFVAQAVAGDGSHRERHEPPFTVSGGVAAPKFGAAGSGGAEYEMLPEAHDRK